MHAQRSPNPPAARQQVEILALDPHGQGVFTIGDTRGTVANVVPGDKVLVERHGRGPWHVSEILAPSPARIPPDCEYHGSCGGCDLLAFSYPACAKAKADLVEQTLRAVTRGIDFVLLPFAAAPQTTRYRHRCRLHQGRNRHAPAAGYLPPEGRGIVPIDHCALLSEPLAQRLPALCRGIAHLPFRLEECRVAAATTGPERVAAHVVLAPGTSAKRSQAALEKLQHAARLCGITVGHPHRGVDLVIGDPLLTGAVAPGVAGGPFLSEPCHFTQGNAAMNGRMVATMRAWVERMAAKTSVELFSGCGNFTLPLAQLGLSVVAVESDPGAVRMAHKNMRRSGLAAKIRLISDHAAQVTTDVPCDLLLLDPPRTGFREIATVASRLRPRNIIYVSCDLSTFRRDAQALVGTGHTLVEGIGLDLYPRTHHVETMAWFQRMAS